MKVLMFGWEFPPHISGGLGTASYGLTKGLANFSDVDVTFVVPKAYGDEDTTKVDKIIGAGDIAIAHRNITFEDVQKKIDFYEVQSNLIPYVGEEEFYKITQKKIKAQSKLVETNEEGCLEFTGKYGADLIQEIYRYSLVARAIAQDNDFDIIHAHDWLAYPAGIEAKKASGKPLVIHVHATDFDRSGGSVNPKVYAIEREGMEAADRIITVSNLTRNIVIEKYGIDPNKVETVYNAVEPIEKKDLSIKKGVDEKIVTFLGRITMQKGPEYFIEAAYKVLEHTDNVRFVMAGNGDLMNKMVTRAAQLGITDKFHFTGFLKGAEVFDMLRISDVYVMPSVSEPFGISPLEAMQADVPVIISKQSGVAEVLKHAIKVDFWDVNALADAIHGIISYPSLPSMFKKYGRLEVDGLEWKKSAEHVKKVYEYTLKLANA
ncbi:glycosyltransferase family 4 protein [Halosquirtibacter laminarini]|uniref:Glycosyltransferase family 4 protein n=1 Tax=Halosquirtibacter laminarini TaxID=3374600 RepID=A0AC61NF85_9BACT|nr:glycosyltransferase family 4 protein [Prolixibacteraceae bacterium]